MLKTLCLVETDSMQAFGISAETDLNFASMKSPYYEIVMRVNETDDIPLYFTASCGENCQGSVSLPISQIIPGKLSQCLLDAWREKG